MVINERMVFSFHPLTNDSHSRTFSQPSASILEWSGSRTWAEHDILKLPRVTWGLCSGWPGYETPAWGGEVSQGRRSVERSGLLWDSLEERLVSRPLKFQPLSSLSPRFHPPKTATSGLWMGKVSARTDTHTVRAVFTEGRNLRQRGWDQVTVAQRNSSALRAHTLLHSHTNTHTRL